MRDARKASGDGARSTSGRQIWRDFRRARHLLWALLAVLALVGFLLHELLSHSLLARLLWTGAVLLAIVYPLGFLLGFRCPRCREVYVATGGLRDFFGLGRILWSQRCGHCSLPAGRPDEAVVSSRDLPDSRPVR
ncbi:MAG: hypothetical protein RL033_2256 [Pseudomonadota bacterium]